MKLALQTEYALRTLMFLAAHGERTTIDAVAELFGISRAHIAKVVNQLSRFGFLRSVRGIGDGIDLSRQADQISVGEVIVAFDGSMHLLDCAAMKNVCVIKSFCKLEGVLAVATGLMASTFEALFGVVPQPIQILGICALMFTFNAPGYHLRHAHI